MIPLLPLTVAILTTILLGALLAWLWIAFEEQQRRYDGEPANAPQENPDDLIAEIASARCQADLCMLVTRAMHLPAPAQEECMRLITIKSIELNT